MTMYDLIVRKKRGLTLTEEEINYMIREFVSGEIPDYQMSAMMMAICFQGMNAEETKALTLAMAHSGDVMDLSPIKGIKVDKHSTGGVGDKTSIVLGPMVASLGIPVAKMSGRGLGHTGGTIDKLESISGFSTALSEEKFIKNVNDIHIAIAGQTKNLAPADKKLYALRDVTGTVDQISLIASSIMSKKLASGADAIVLDVKTGNGAFMKSLKDARALAEEMVEIGYLSGKKMKAVITDMDQPLGYAVGNALEVKEAIDTLKGHGPEDLTELVITLGSYMVIAAEKADTFEDAAQLMEMTLKNGDAWKKFCEFVEAQGGDVSQVQDKALLPCAKYIIPVKSEESGYVTAIETEEIGRICLLLGGGRETKESIIDPAVGIVLCRKKGDYIAKDEILAYIHADDDEKLSEAEIRLRAAYSYSDFPVVKESIIKEVI